MRKLPMLALAAALAVPVAARAAPVSLGDCGRVTDETAPQQVMKVLLCAARDHLRDPSSGAFRRVFLSRLRYIDGRQPPWAWMLCGEMNGKNGYGGMTGWQVFSYVPTEAGSVASENGFLNGPVYCTKPDLPVFAGSR